ncbi:hypothetical protein IMZ48_06770 [Candidatus Bathyarchaeota archaeon]|nr:hypothetical protein [Candidatus Bathyarchaeota archaeon]
MHAITIVTIITFFATGIHAQDVGTFDIFADPACSGANMTIAVEGRLGRLPLIGRSQRAAHSARSHLETCYRKFHCPLVG